MEFVTYFNGKFERKRLIFEAKISILRLWIVLFSAYFLALTRFLDQCHDSSGGEVLSKPWNGDLLGIFFFLF